MLVGLFFNEVMFFGGIIFWAMPSARATPGSLPLGCLWRTKPCVSLSHFFILLFFWLIILVFVVIFIWAIPSARAAPGSLPLGYCCAMN